MKNKLLIRLVTIGAMLITGSNASAGVYFGGGLGTASWDLKPFYGTFELEDGAAIRLFGGTRFGYFGGEMELAFSAHDWKGSGGQITHNATSVIFSGVGYLPLANFVDAYGKLGMNLWGTSVDVADINLEGDNGIDIAFGVGLSFNATPNLLIRLEYQSMPGLGDSVDEGDISQFTVNGAYSY